MNDYYFIRHSSGPTTRRSTKPRQTTAQQYTIPHTSHDNTPNSNPNLVSYHVLALSHPKYIVRKPRPGIGLRLTSTYDLSGIQSPTRSNQIRSGDESLHIHCILIYISLAITYCSGLKLFLEYALTAAMLSA